MIFVFIFLIPSCKMGANELPDENPETSAPNQLPVVTDKNATEIVAWVPVTDGEQWRINKLIEAARQVDAPQVHIDPIGMNMTDENYELQLQQAAESGTAPDIAFGWNGRPQAWARSGLLAPLDECRAKHQPLANIIDPLWQQASWQGQTWGVPVTLQIRPLFFNKQVLGELAWSQAAIDALPDKIEKGEFTLDNMLQIAAEAIEAGLIEPGFAYWPKPGETVFEPYIAYGGEVYDPGQQKLVIHRHALEQSFTFRQQQISQGLTLEHAMIPTQNEWATLLLWHDAVVHGRVLFWYGSSEDWSLWTNQFAANLGGQAYMDSFAGYALFPSALANISAKTRASTNFYVLFSENASGHTNQEAACQVLAGTANPEINALHVEERMDLGTIKSQINDPVFISMTFTKETTHMIDHAWYLPYQIPELDVYQGILEEYALKVERSELSSDAAAAQAVRQLINVLGDKLIVKE